MDLQDLDRALGPVDDPVAPVEPVAPTGPVTPIGPVAPIEPGTSWRAALSAWGRPSGDQVSDEHVFAILNGGSDGITGDELCAALGVTLPTYCVWKSKYRKLDLEQIRQARRRERRRRHTVIGAVALVAVLLTGGIGATLVRAVSATFKGDGESPTAPVTSTLTPIPSSAMRRPSPAPAAVREIRVADPRPVPDAPKTPSLQDPKTPGPHAPKPSSPQDLPETGFRIQVTAADTEPQGQAFVARLTSQGYSAYLQQAVVGNREVFRVRVGPFDTEAAARGAAAQLKAAGYAGVWLVR